MTVCIPWPMGAVPASISMRPSSVTRANAGWQGFVATGEVGPAADADARQPSVSGGLTGSLVFAELPVADLVEGLFQRTEVVGFIHHQSAGHLSGEVRGPQQVAAADLGWVEAQGVGQLVHGSLQQADGLGPTRTPVRSGGSGVGHHRRRGDRNLVDPIGGRA